MDVDCMDMLNVWNGMRLCMRNMMKQLNQVGEKYGLYLVTVVLMTMDKK